MFRVHACICGHFSPRARADMMQEYVVAKMDTAPPYIAKLEVGTVSPSMKAPKRMLRRQDRVLKSRFLILGNRLGKAVGKTSTIST